MDNIAGKFILSENQASAEMPVKLPVRATNGSAGYDFHCPEQVILEPGKSQTIKTGIIADINPGYALLLMPRSGLGMKGLFLANTIGLIDSDYKLEIMAKLVNNGEDTIVINQGDRYMQGVFIKYGIVEDDVPLSKTRSGGMGSTGS